MLKKSQKELKGRKKGVPEGTKGSKKRAKEGEKGAMGIRWGV